MQRVLEWLLLHSLAGSAILWEQTLTNKEPWEMERKREGERGEGARLGGFKWHIKEIVSKYISRNNT